ncbi:MAG: plasmid partitioning protein RepB [Hyphomicrobiaceae bacterium]|nr:plasmid partitioning protein RepB [Hyphomicrobiaceae bacterium]MCC0013990.1 plasmid partitioning protein RepB [Rhodobiaceae bacterium]
MSRKNPFDAIDIAALSGAQSTKPGYGMTGAAKTVVRSIEEMAENTKKLMDGEIIIDLDPTLLDDSSVSDRLSTEDDEFEELKQAIRDHGQSTPILVRPNPNDGQRYMVVFGHRRARVAKDLGITVKAVVKRLDDIASAVAQGQENSARSNLSFIERAFFAQNLLSRGMTKDVVKSSIGIDDAMLSKMLSVIETVPAEMLTMLGASKKIGRDKWLKLRQMILNPSHLSAAQEYISSADFVQMAEDNRFDALSDYLRRYKVKSAAKTPKKTQSSKSWTSPDSSVNFVMNARSKKVAMEFTNSEARPFGNWLSDHLDRLYDEYRRSKPQHNGD